MSFVNHCAARVLGAPHTCAIIEHGFIVWMNFFFVKLLKII